MEDSITERELKTGIEDYQQNDDEDEAHQGDEQVKGGGSSEEYRKEEKGQSAADEDQVELGSGIINNLISNLFHHTDEGDQGEVKNIEEEVDHDQGKDQVQEGEKGEMEVSGGGGGGRLINNLISNFFQQNEGEGEGGGEEKEKSTEEKKGVVDEGIDEQVKVEEEGGAGGIINNIVSNLPLSLQKNSAPASDEASILIHSIIHD